MVFIVLFSLISIQPLHAEEPTTVKPNTLGGFRNNIIETSDIGGVKNKQDDLASVVGTVIYSLLSLLGIIIVCYIVYGGYLWMTAQGSDENIKHAKKILRDATIGMMVIFTSWIVIGFVLDLLAQNAQSPGTSGTSSADCTTNPCAQGCPAQACLDSSLKSSADCNATPCAQGCPSQGCLDQSLLENN